MVIRESKQNSIEDKNLFEGNIPQKKNLPKMRKMEPFSKRVDLLIEKANLLEQQIKEQE